jgi:hypothetical protein
MQHLLLLNQDNMSQGDLLHQPGTTSCMECCSRQQPVIAAAVVVGGDISRAVPWKKGYIRSI